MRFDATICILALAAACTSPKPSGGDTDAADTDVAHDTDVVHGVDHPPTAPEVSLSPLSPTSADDLNAYVVADATDPDGDALTYSYVWLRDGAPQAAITTGVVSAADTSRGETWQVRVIASDGTLAGPAGSAQVTVVDAMPTLSLTWADPSPLAQQDLAVVPVTADPDGDTVSLTYAWTLDGVAFAESSDTVSRLALHPGQVWGVTVTADDGHGGTATADLQVTIGDAAPVITGVFLSPSPAADSQALTASATVSDPDGDALTTTWDFYRNGALFRSGTDANLLPAATVVGDTWTATVTVSDGTLTTGPTPSNTVRIQDLPPSKPIIAITPGNPQPCDNLGCNFLVGSEDPDGTDVDEPVTWTRNGVLTNHHSGIPASEVEAGDVWTCSVTPTSNGLSGPTASTTVTIGTGDAEESFAYTAPRPYDLLMVVDSTAAAGTADAQTWLKAATASLIDTLDAAHVDYHIGVTSMAAGGRMRRTAGGVLYVDPSTPNSPDVLASLLDVGTSDLVHEGAHAAMHALTEPLVSTANAGFVRPGSQLELYFVTAQSEGFSEDYVLGPLYETWSPADLVVRHLMFLKTSSWCTMDEPYNYAGLVNRTYGHYAVTCAGPLDTEMQNLAGDASSISRRFVLARSTITNLHASLEHTPGVLTALGTSDYSTTKSVVYVHTPPLTSGDTVHFTYDYTCTGDEDPPVDTQVGSDTDDTDTSVP